MNRPFNRNNNSRGKRDLHKINNFINSEDVRVILDDGEQLGVMKKTEAIVEASCQRMRPVLLTSITTIAGLLPLLFERSMQAQFLIPMAISICFGLVFATVLILVVIPAMVTLGASDS